MTKLLIGTLSLALVGVGGLVAAVDGFGDDRPVRSVSIPAGTTGDVGDVPGPCDEPEHANDPRCTGVAMSTDRVDDQPGRTVTTSGAVDVSGPCDEPEHANDPRCTGITPAQTVNITSANSPMTVKATLDHLTHAYKVFRPGNGTRPGSRLRVNFNGTPTANGTAGTLLVARGTEDVEILPFSLNAAGDGKRTVAFGSGTVSAVAVILTNSSRSFSSCFSGRPFSCGGVPRHEDQVFKVKATLLR